MTRFNLTLLTFAWLLTLAPVGSAQTRKPLAVLDGDPRGVDFVAFSPDGKLLAVVGRTRGAILYDVASREECAAFPGAWGMAVFTRGGKTVASGNYEGKVRLWYTLTGK